MRVTALALLGALGLAAAVAPANAAPMVRALPMPEASNILQVAGGCGPRLHRNHRGYCVRNRAYRPHAYYRRYYRPYAYHPSDRVANWLNGQEARRGGYWGYYR
jgi:hypothetical protein